MRMKTMARVIKGFVVLSDGSERHTVFKTGRGALCMK
jgi:hypothetical protein